MAAASSSRPSWQHDECPPWCVVEHREDDPPSDRVHDSAGVYVPVVLARGPHRRDTGVELLVVLSRECGAGDDWVFVGEPQRDGQHLCLSRESAARVSEALAALLAG